MAKQRPWPPGEPGERMRDERLVFLAAKPALDRLARPLWLTVITVGSARGSRSRMGSNTKHAFGSARMGQLAMACEVARQRMTPDELALVRSRGELPDWFMAEVRKAKRRG